MDKKKLKKIGRPTDYTPDLAKEICDTIASASKGIKQLCKENDHWPSHTSIYRWRSSHSEFGDQYAQAKVQQIDCLVDEILEIADDTSQDYVVNEQGNTICNSEFIARSRLRIDTRKWLASKLVPKVYGVQRKEEDVTDKSYHEQLLELQ